MNNASNAAKSFDTANIVALRPTKLLDNHGGAIAIGLETMGCASETGASLRECGRLSACTSSEVCSCAKAAMEMHPEAQMDILVASFAIMAQNAKSIGDIQRGVVKLEQLVDEVAAI